jgi:hypothetical protein
MAARRDEATRSIPVGVIETLLLRFEVSITIETRTIVGASTECSLTYLRNSKAAANLSCEIVWDFGVPRNSFNCAVRRIRPQRM